MCKNDCIQACCQPTRVTSSKCVQNYETTTGNSLVWTCSVCFTGIWCRTETSVSISSLLFFVPPISFPHGQFFFSTESRFYCRRNLHFRGKFPCLSIVWMPNHTWSTMHSTSQHSASVWPDGKRSSELNMEPSANCWPAVLPSKQTK